MCQTFKVIITLLCVVINYVVSSEKKIVCYYGSWSYYRHGNGKFEIENINPHLCTHLIYTFVGLNQDGSIAILDPYLDLSDNWGRGNIPKFAELKSQNPNLKTMIAVGGWNEGSGKYSTMANDPQLRQNFVNSVVENLQKFNLDGFDVDWEYPNQRDSTHGAVDIDNFTTLLKELKEQFVKYGYLLSVAAAALKHSASLSYNIAAMSQHVDFVNVMAYDFAGSWDSVIGYNAPLYAGADQESKPAEDLWTVETAIEYWLSEGCPPEKIVLGLALYGRTFSLSNPEATTAGSSASGPGLAGLYTGTSGLIGYNEFCEIQLTQPYTVKFDSQARVPYAYNGRNWITYDDPNSLTEKVEYALAKDIGGVMIWSIETDDFRGICGNAYPLLRAINEALGKHDTVTTTTTTTTTSTEAPTTGLSSTSTDAPTTTTSQVPSTSTTTKSPESSSSELPSTTDTSSSTTTETSSVSSSTDSPTTSTPETTATLTSTSTPVTTIPTSAPVTTTTVTSPALCQEAGIISHPDDCSKFIYCIDYPEGLIQPVVFQCPKNLLWDQRILTCNYVSYVTCL
ncbi:probable chitinase 2 [Plutella xylostella]|uniref:probable chitinase 2 n=1 Tax=Plutella xylostella TaxID=51655 RepID=UPI002032F3B1|nr:probable chitinase 2 [Plutella xylostella]